MLGKQFAAVFLLSMGLAAAQTQIEDTKTQTQNEDTKAITLGTPGGDRRLADQMYQSGNTMVTAGHILATGGLLLSVVGSFAEAPALSIIGNVSNTIGVPLLGVGAGKVNNAGELMDPSYTANYRGWGWYWTGFAMGGLGTILIINAANDFNEATTEEEQDEAAGAIAPALLLLLGSAVCNITSWVKFANLAGEGRRAVQYRSSLEVMPQLQLAKDGSLTPGLGLAYRF